MANIESRKSIPVYTVDAFTDEPFRGNPAAVCLLPQGVVSLFTFLFKFSYLYWNWTL